MQDAFGRDMFNVPNINSSRYNGHVHISSGAKGSGGKKDRKGCTKGKIEAIMKNNTSRPKLCVTVPSKKSVSTSSSLSANHHVVYTNTIYAHLKLSDQEDPYTFTESEPQSINLYHQQGASSTSSSATTSSKKLASLIRTPPNMVCADKSKLEQSRMTIKQNSRTGTPALQPPPGGEGSSKMNKLQADIARSKVIGKRRKVDHQPVNSSTSADWTSSKKDRGRICIAAKFVPRKSSWQKECKSRHELLQRILEAQSDAQLYTKDLYPLGIELSDSDDDSENSVAVYERHWFSRSGVEGQNGGESGADTGGGGGGGTRERRVEETRTELRRKLTQTLRGLANAELPSRDLLTAVIAAARKFPNATASILNPARVRPNTQKPIRGAKFLVTGEKCSYSEGCNWQSLPCTRHCSQHIMYNVDQRLFSHCTAKFSDNTQCSLPAFDVLHDLPLCSKHAATQDHYNKYSGDSKSGKKVSKKSRSVGGSSRSGKRNQKKRKKASMSPPRLPPVLTHSSTTTMTTSLSSHSTERSSSPPMSVVNSSVMLAPPTPVDHHDTHHISNTSTTPPHHLIIDTPLPNTHHNHIHLEDAVEEVSEEVLEIAALDPAELASQASRLLEEHDITNMLNQISPDAFNDLFTDKNGEYEPTREETEELERALEAVDNDVRSLERMTRSLPLPLPLLQLDSITLLEDTAAPTGPFPPFQNGFPATGGSNSTTTAAGTELGPSS